MPTFSYKAVDEDGRRRVGRINAANIGDLEQRLSRIGLYLIAGKIVSANPFSRLRGKIKRQNLISFCFHLEQIGKAGVPLLEGLCDLRDSIEYPQFRDIITDLIEQIEGGMSLSHALSAYPGVFEPVFVSLVRAGEETGKLPEVFGSLTETLKWQDEMAAKTRKLLMYPVFVGLTIISVVFFLMIYLVPQLTAFVKGMGQELPFYTKALIFISDTVIHYWHLILGVPVIFAGLFKILLAGSFKFRFRMDGWKLNMWVIGAILNKVMLARFATFFAMMYAAGITILDSIRISEDIAGNLVIADGLKRIGAQIAEGQSLTASFQNVGLFPPLVIRMLRVGETTGALDSAMRNVSYFYDREAKEAVERLQTMIEPIMTITMGLILGWVMLAVIGPIYSAIGKI